MSEVAWKLADVAEWEAARASGAYAGSALDLADGFIHLSTGAQLAETARKHYAGRRDLVLVEVALADLGDTLKFEPSRGGDLFPHIYGALPFSAVRGERRLHVDEAGVMQFDDGATGWG
ncbi:DUF952 domain-containing protein [Brevundimonas kwangchunensis]|uniref:DUF952 domain-containing protein n=1 Tax=Brevundimonas kwangchunensis TaxID=322163 RepID=A0ABN1GRE2_9CAUL